jgi:vitamin B12 transporter
MHGVESFLSVAVTDRLKVRADYTATFTENKTTGLGLLRRPRDKVTLATLWNPIDGLVLSSTVLYVSSWVDIGREGTPPRLNGSPYTTVNLAANYDVNPHLTVFGRVDNLLNQKVENPIGFLQPSLGVYGGVRVTN